MMTTAELIRKLCHEKDVSLAELARRTGQSRQNLYNKLRRDSISVSELTKIAEALDMKYEQSFISSNEDKSK